MQILENFSLVLALSLNMKSIILLSCLEILDHIGVKQTCDSKRVIHYKRSHKGQQQVDYIKKVVGAREVHVQEEGTQTRNSKRVAYLK